MVNTLQLVTVLIRHVIDFEFHALFTFRAVTLAMVSQRFAQTVAR
jgi:hypothetical protein